MLIDNSLILDAAFALTTTGSSTNYIDTVGAASGQAQISGVNTIQGGNDAYKSLWWEVIVGTSFTGNGGSTVDFQLWTSNVVAQIWTTGNGGSLPTASTTVPTTKLLSTGALAYTALTAKSVLIKARLPQGCQEFVSSFYNVFGTIGAGKITNVLVPDVDINLT